MGEVVEDAIFHIRRLIFSFIVDQRSPLVPLQGAEGSRVPQHDLIFPTPYTLPYLIPYTLRYLIPYLTLYLTLYLIPYLTLYLTLYLIPYLIPYLTLP